METGSKEIRRSVAGFYQQGPKVPGGFGPDKSGRPVVTWALLAVNILVWIATEIAGGSEDTQVLLDFGAMFGPIIANGEYWRLFTAMFLHVGLMHLLFNGLALLIFGQVVERTYGHLQFAIIYVLAGLAGSVASYLLSSIAVGAGASGAIFGVLGALAAFFVARRDILGEMGRQNLSGILIISGINLFFGFATPGIDNWAHMGGFVAGFALGLALAPQYQSMVSHSGVLYSVAGSNVLVRRLWVLPVAVIILLAGTWLATATLPDNPLTHVYNAERHFGQQRYEEAVEDIQRAVQLNPLEGRAYYVRGKILVEMGDPDAARVELYKSIALAGQAGDRDTKDDASKLLTFIGN